MKKAYLKSILKSKQKSFATLLLCITLSAQAEMSDAQYQQAIKQQSYNTYQNFININTINPIAAAAGENNRGNNNNNQQNRLINCWDEAGKTYQVDPWLLFAYAKTESSFNPNAVNANRASVDRGIMQINSIWLPTLAKYNISSSHLFDSCVSIFVGAWIIRQNIDRYGYNFYGLSAYNVGNPKNPNLQNIAQNYYKKLIDNYALLQRKYRPQPLRVATN